MLRLKLGGLVPCPELASQALSVAKPAILDVGSGNGRWAMEMAVERPEGYVVGLDITPIDLAQ